MLLDGNIKYYVMFRLLPVCKMRVNKFHTCMKYVFLRFKSFATCRGCLSRNTNMICNMLYYTSHTTKFMYTKRHKVGFAKGH